MGFIDAEFARIKPVRKVADHCSVLDSLAVARRKHPGQKNSLDALCKRYGVDNSGRDLHGALLDAEILADVWLTMTGGQTNLSLAGDGESSDGGRPQPAPIRRLPADRPRTAVLRATEEEVAAHMARMAAIEKAAGAAPLWTQLEV